MEKARIMVTEDESIVAFDLKSTLEGLGHTVPAVAASGEEAIRKAEETRPDLVLMDIMLKGDMDGVEAAGHIRARFGIPVVFVTAYADETILARAKETEPYGYIIKPFEEREVFATVEIALRKRELDEELRQYRDHLEGLVQERTAILATTSHELKTPITSIVNQVYVMLRQQDRVGHLTELQQEYLEDIQEDACRLKNLVEDLLDVATVDSNTLTLTFTELDVQQEIQGALRICESQIHENEMHVALNIPPDLCKVKADRLRFAQVLGNLISNASKYSPKGATTTITAKEKGDFVQIDVSDTGIGIPESVQSKIFDKFFRVDNSSTRTEAGTGIGLFIVKCLVETHGGEIWVESGEGNGSTFSFTLPQADGAGTHEGTPLQSELAVNI